MIKTFKILKVNLQVMHLRSHMKFQENKAAATAFYTTTS